MQEVLESEGKPIEEDEIPWNSIQDVIEEAYESSLFYETEIGALSAYAIFGFEQDRLVEGSYIFTGTHATYTDADMTQYAYVHDFHQIKRLLTKKYQEPTDEYVDDERLHLSAEWTTEDSRISHILMRVNDKIVHHLSYSESQDLKQL